MRILLLMFAAIVLGGGGGYWWLLKQTPVPAAPVEEAAPVVQREILTAATELPPGHILGSGDLARLPVEGDLPQGALEATAENEALLLGSVVRNLIGAGAPIELARVVQPGERGFVAAILPKGERAISIPITETEGVSGLVMPGDRVDLILTYTVVPLEGVKHRDVRASETVLRNIRVIALDQRLHQESVASQEPGIAAGPPIARTATLQVTPREAEMATLATQLGTLSLVLNSVHDGGDTKSADDDTLPGRHRTGHARFPRPMTLDSDVSTLLLMRMPEPEAEEPAAEESPSAEAMRRRESVQIVRGATASDRELGEAEPEAAGQAAPQVEEAPRGKKSVNDGTPPVYASETSFASDGAGD